jgi:hypothetical protein
MIPAYYHQFAHKAQRCIQALPPGGPMDWAYRIRLHASFAPEAADG